MRVLLFLKNMIWFTGYPPDVEHPHGNGRGEVPPPDSSEFARQFGVCGAWMGETHNTFGLVNRDNHYMM